MRNRARAVGTAEVEEVEKEAEAQLRASRRRGRRPARPDPDSGPVGAFADRLWRLKQEAGDPSYEEMSLRLGAAASRSSLAAAANGRTLPSWETTWEFVRVLAVDRLGRDPRDTEKEWRERWTRARAADRTVDLGPEPSGAEQASPVSATSESTPPAEPAQSVAIEDRREPAPSRRRTGVAVGAAALVLLAGVVLAVVVLDRRSDDSGAAPAVADHDDSRFEGDITYPDGSLVPPNSSFTKVWRLRNTGTVVWANRLLARANEEACQAPDMVAIPQTKPGETVDIAVTVQTPGKPGRCKIYWKMADEQGRTLFPLKRPIFLDVQVGAS
jgi:hypothetical protein